MALALYRKYRPATFAEVVGQEHVTAPLMNAVDGGRINHAYLFSGPRGCGKTSSARILARSLNCEQGPTSTPCGVCGSCIALAPDGPGSLDVMEIDAASHGGVDDARDLRERAFFAPVNSRYKVYIVDEAHMVTTQGFNALLKVVEEPPEFLVFVFATTEPDKVLSTIRSRTHHYPFRLVPPTTLRGLLEKTCVAEGVTVEPTVFPLVVRAGGGSVRDSLSILDQLLAGAGPEGVTYKTAVGLLGVTDDALLDETIDALAAHDAPAVFRAVDRVVEAGHDPRRFATDLLDRLRDLIVLDAVPEAGGNGLLDCPARPAGPDEPAGPGPGLGDAVADGRHGARRASPRCGGRRRRGCCSSSSAPACCCPPPTARRSRPSSGSSASSAGCPSPASTPAAGRRGAGPRGARPREAPVREPASPPRPPRPPRRRPPHRRPSRPQDAGRSARGYVRPSQRTETAAAGPAAGTGRRRGAGRRRLAGDRQAGLGQPPGPRPRRPAAPAPTRQPPKCAGGEPDIPLPPEPTDDEDWPHPAQPGGRPRRRGPHGRAGARRSRRARAAESSPVPRGGEPTPVVSANPEPAADGELTTSDVRRVWPELLAVVKRHKRTTEALLKSAQVHGLANGVLTLAATSPALAKMLGDDLNRDVLRQALQELLGVRWKVTVVVEGAAAATGAPVAPEQAREAARVAEAAEANELMAERAAESRPVATASPSPPSTRSRPRCRCSAPSSAPARSTASGRGTPELRR